MRARLPALALVLAAAQMPSFLLAQEVTGTPTRARLLEAARRAKAEAPEPPQRRFFERFLYRGEQSLIVQKVAAGWRGFTLATGGMPAGGGTDLGIGYGDSGIGRAYPHHDTPDRLEVRVFATYSTRRFRQAQGRLTWNDIGGSRLAASLFGHVFRWPERDFFGRGARSSDVRTTYAEDGTELGGDLWLRLAERSRIGVGLYRLDPDVGPGAGPDGRATQDVFDADEAPGLERDAAFRRLDTFVDLDLRDNPAYPRAGGWYSLRFSDYADTVSGSFSFRRYEADLQHYLPFQDRRKVLALRLLSVLSDPKEGAEVPVYLWPTLGGSRQMRGFASARLQDRNLLLLTTEYRWQIWWVLDAALFLDLGNVTEEPGDLTDDMRAAYGFGFRLHSLDAFLGRIDFAFRDGGFRAHLAFTYPFAAGGLTR